MAPRLLRVAARRTAGRVGGGGGASGCGRDCAGPNRGWIATRRLQRGTSFGSRPGAGRLRWARPSAAAATRMTLITWKKVREKKKKSFHP